VVQGVVHDENCYVMGGISGHAGLFGTAGDVLQFARAMLGRIMLSTGRNLFEPHTVQQFTQRCILPEGTTRALGWDTPSESGSSAGTTFFPGSFGHLGFTGTSLWIDPLRGIAAVLLTNRTFPSRENKKIQVVRPLFHNSLLERIKTLPPRGDNAH
jgi:CubicO group peptidase (beta-lactamase class C family)